MIFRADSAFRNLIAIGLAISVLGGYWLLPIQGDLVLNASVPTETAHPGWQPIRLEPENPKPGEKVTVAFTDTTPWSHIAATVTDSKSEYLGLQADEDHQRWSWRWVFVAPDLPGYKISFYRDCKTGCIEQMSLVVGRPAQLSLEQLVPTKLGIVFANPQRNWHQRSGWDVELTYAKQPDESYWGIDELAFRVQNATAKGLRVLVRVDYDQGQTLPPAGNNLALEEYLDHLRRLSRDERLNGVYGYIIGSGYNSLGSNQQGLDHPVTPEWYARIFNGYSADPLQNDNAVEVIRSENYHVRVLVGPVQPWITDQNGNRRHSIDVPWLNFMNTMLAGLDTSTAANDALGIARTAPDGFAIQVPGRPDASEFGGRLRSDEPYIDLSRPAWNGAQAGFKLYQDWISIINVYPHTRNLPVFITSTNTYAPDEKIAPADNYPRGWLSAALDVVNTEPQIQALCWFMDYIPDAAPWEKFRLSDPHGLLVEAADEFDKLLQLKP
jgi:hypothetical protein